MMITLEVGEATAVTRLLELLAELPSTPPFVAEDARRRMADLEELVPPPVRHQHAGERHRHGTVTVRTVPATAIAGLLELLAELPSTPPAVAEDARRRAESLWAALPSPGREVTEVDTDLDSPGDSRH